MIINSLELQNFGVYSAKTIINLSPSPERKTVILTGSNGSGKTTLFEAILLCIYGVHFRGRKLKKREYEAHLKRRLHKNSSGRETSASLRLHLSYVEGGREYRLTATRSWRYDNSRISEYLSLTVEDESGCPQMISNPQEFLLNLFPIGLSQLLFFDGEKIKQFAENIDPNGLLRDGFHAIVGLDLIKRAGRDVSYYLSRFGKKESHGLKSQYDQIDGEIDELRHKKENIEGLLTVIEEDMLRYKGKQSEIEQRLAREGSEYSKKRENLLEEMKKTELRIESIRREITKLCEGLLPFSFASDLAKSTCMRLNMERDLREAEAKEHTVIQVKTIITETLHGDSYLKDNLNTDAKKQISKRLFDAIDSIAPVQSNNSAPRLDMSQSQLYKSIETLERATGSIPSSLRELIRKYAEKTSRLESLSNDLSKAPVEESIKPLITDLNETTKSIADQEVRREGFLRLIESTESSIQQKENERLKILDSISRESKEIRKAELAGKMLKVLGEFEEHLEENRVKELELKFTEIFNSLRPHSKQISKIELDAYNLSAKIHGHDGSLSESSMLSAGEKQIYAMALLLAITSVSSRMFPLVIDTPLARLDKKHRTNMIRKLADSAFDQLVLFATNTEITKAIRDELDPYLCREISLRYNGKSENTTTRTVMEVS